jgi:hypothetical protein
MQPETPKEFSDSQAQALFDEIPQQPSRRLPFSAWYPFVAGLLAGMVLRFLFSGHAGSAWSAMAGAFIYLAPLLVGAVTVYVAETIRRRNWGYYFWAPFLANAIFIIGTLIINIEGMICAIVILPLFSLLGAVGGVVMGVVCRATNWPKPTLYSLAALPLLLGLAAEHLPTPAEHSSVRQSIVVQATPEQIWAQLNRATDIEDSEFASTWAARIGVPMPVSGVTEQVGSERVRKSVWAKQVFFDEPLIEWQPARHMRWGYRFHKDSFPAGALDDHVVIGGHYFDLKSTAFTLTPTAQGTRLDIETHYRVSTQFNFYAEHVAQFLLSDMQSNALNFYKQRSERSAAAPASTL